MPGLTLGLGLGLQRQKAAASALQPLSISGTPVTTATQGTAYAGFTATASYGTAPYTYSLVGTWPAGISINSSTGEVSGTPTESGSFTGLSVRVTDAASNTADLPSFALAVAAAAPTDPYFANVVLLCGFDGVDGATVSSDESSRGHALTFVGNAQIDTAQSVFGGASLLLDGDGDAVTAANHSDFLFGAGQFTVEARVRINATLGSSSVHYICGVQDTTGQRSWGVAVGGTAGGFAAVKFLYSSDGTTSTLIEKNVASALGFAGTFSVTRPGRFFNLAVDRDDADSLRIYVDGAMVHKATVSATLHASTAALGVGNNLPGGVPSTTSGLPGWIDEVRITKGVARYASDAGFTVPAAPYPRS